jgi:hypothetical protein
MKGGNIRETQKHMTKGGEKMRSMEIYFRDLNEEAQERYRETFGRPEDMNIDLFPLAIVDMEDPEDEEE